jgi:hypothetical protein
MGGEVELPNGTREGVRIKVVAKATLVDKRLKPLCRMSAAAPGGECDNQSSIERQTEE